MSLEVVLTAVSTTAAAVWILCRYLARIEAAITGHVSDDKAAHLSITNRLIRVEKRVGLNSPDKNRN